MNDRFDLRIITQPHSQVYWGYFRRLVFGNSSTKHNKLTYFSNSMLFCSDVLLPFSHIPRCIHAKTPDFPRQRSDPVNGAVSSDELYATVRLIYDPEPAEAGDSVSAHAD